jgi:hypothetical protein
MIRDDGASLSQYLVVDFLKQPVFVAVAYRHNDFVAEVNAHS